MRHRQATRAAAGFTVVELVAIVGVIGVGAACMTALTAQPTFGKPGEKSQPSKDNPDRHPDTDKEEAAPAGTPPNLITALARARANARQLKCATQVRGIVQANIVWASNNQGRYPQPSLLDTADATVAEKGRAKDTTANIYSLLIWNGMISPEIAISPAEKNKSIRLMEDYEYSAPKKAVKAADALWDPAFRADFANGIGHTSYAHLQPSGNWNPDEINSPQKNKPYTSRMQMWSDTYSGTEPILGNRGPEIESVTTTDVKDESKYTVKTKLEKSVTYGIHGGAKSWEGNIGFNDNHVEFVTTLGPGAQQPPRWYSTKEDAKKLDVMFFDEPDDKHGSNSFLGIFIKAGTKPEEFKGIWD